MKKLCLKIDWRAIWKVASKWLAAAIVAFVMSLLNDTNFVNDLIILASAVLTFAFYDAIKTDDSKVCCDSKKSSDDSAF